jgi:hypothetical protein
MRKKYIVALLILTLILTACSAAENPLPSSPEPAPASTALPTPTDDPSILPTLFPNMAGNSDLQRTDQQGMVVVVVTPTNLGTPADNLEFEVSMNTHSVDLSMDLATQATLTTDAGLTVSASTWDAPRGGHHVSGKLIFPATQNGTSILQSATKLTLTITNVDVPTRVFEWALN